MSYCPNCKRHMFEDRDHEHAPYDGHSRDEYLKEKGHKQYDGKCRCQDYSHLHDGYPRYDHHRCHCLDHHDCRCADNHHHHHDCGCHRHHNHCRRYLCDDDFRLRLGGLQNNLNFKLRQLIGCMVEMELEDNSRLEAQICFVGSNFVEVKKYEDEPYHEEETDNHDGQEHAEVSEAEDKEKKRHCYSLIIPVDRIKYVEINHGEKCC